MEVAAAAARLREVARAAVDESAAAVGHGSAREAGRAAHHGDAGKAALVGVAGVAQLGAYSDEQLGFLTEFLRRGEELQRTESRRIRALARQKSVS